MRNYELVLIIDPKSQTMEQKKWTEKVKKWLGGVDCRIEKEENWGRKKLAYLIKKNSEGLYFFYLLQAEPSALKNLENKIKLDESILRYLIINRD